MKFSQIYISKTLEGHFGENFINRWNLDKYHDSEKPSVFLGLYHKNDIDTLLNHRGKFLVVWGGGDMGTSNLALVKELILKGLGYTISFPGHFSNSLKGMGIPHASAYFEIKDYSNFKPIKLGDKIYIYKGWRGNRANYFKWEETVKPIVKYFGQDRIIYADNIDDISQLREDVYKKSFVYIKPTPRGGCTTMFELGYMGIRTIGIGKFNLPNYIEYKDTKSLIHLIKKEECRIGKTDLVIPAKLKKIFIDSRWLDLKYWSRYESK